MTKRKAHILDDVWKEMKRKYVDEWEPTDNDEKWLIETVGKLKVGGLWHFPAAGATFEKVGADHLRLKSIQTDDPLKAMIEIEKTKKVGKRAGIKIDTEKAADYILFHL